MEEKLQETDPTGAGPAGLGLRVLHLSIVSLLLRAEMPPNLYLLNQGSQCMGMVSKS